jgi:hypothetical protein
LHIQFTWYKKEKNDPTIERGKIWIPIIKLGIRPTSTPGPRKDQLIFICLLGLVLVLKHNLFFCPFVTMFGFCFCGSDLGPFSLLFLFAFVKCFG